MQRERKSKNGVLVSVLGAASVLLTACGSIQADDATTADAGPAEQAVDATVNVLFDANDCPVSVDAWDIDLGQKTPGKQNRIIWQAKKFDSSTQSWKVADVSYEIYFDPFKKSDAQKVPSEVGQMRSPQLASNSAAPNNVTYKYTILGDDCPDHPLDPFVRVRN